MYAYKKKMKKKVVLIGTLSMALVASVALVVLLNQPNDKKVAIIKEEDEMVITLPENEQKIVSPFKVEATVVKAYFDGKDHEVDDFTNLEGVYRPNQGIDYAFNDTSFDVLCMVDGVVSEVKEDALFGNSITITSGNVKITYQSLDAINYQKEDVIKQNDVIGKASLNAYNPELKNHVHIVASVNEQLKNPASLVGKTVEELK